MNYNLIKKHNQNLHKKFPLKKFCAFKYNINYVPIKKEECLKLIAIGCLELEFTKSMPSGVINKVS